MTAKTANRSVVLTPPGTGAIGVIRVVGPDAAQIVRQVCRDRDGKACGLLREGRLYYATVHDDGEIIDDVIVSLAPSSSGTAVELCAHGGVRVMERILAALARCGAPLASGDRDVAAALPAAHAIDRECLQALQTAKTARAVRFIAYQRGCLANALGAVGAMCTSNPGRAAAELRKIASRLGAARTLLEGATVAIIGAPNAGKSTLFNALLRRSAALVSSRSGTTRDLVTAECELDGIPVTLVDTAGVQDTGHPQWGDPEEALAISRGRERARHATMTLLVLDGSRPIPATANAGWGKSPDGTGAIVVCNKSDLSRDKKRPTLPESIPAVETPPIQLSAKTGQGLDRLVEHLTTRLGVGSDIDTQPTLFTPRQARLAESVLAELPKRPVIASRSISEQLIGL